MLALHYDASRHYRNWTELTILIWRKIHDIAHYVTLRDITAYITRNVYCGDIVPVFHHHAMHETYATHGHQRMQLLA